MDGWECCSAKYDAVTLQCIICGTVRARDTTPCTSCKMPIPLIANYCPYCKVAQDDTLLSFPLIAECARAFFDMQKVRDTCAHYAGKSMQLGPIALVHTPERTTVAMLCVAKATKLSQERIFIRAVDLLVGRLNLGDVWSKNQSVSQRNACARHLRLVCETYSGVVATQVNDQRAGNLAILKERGIDTEGIDKAKLNISKEALEKLCVNGDISSLKKKHRKEAIHTNKQMLTQQPAGAVPVAHHLIDPTI